MINRVAENVMKLSGRTAPKIVAIAVEAHADAVAQLTERSVGVGGPLSLGCKRMGEEVGRLKRETVASMRYADRDRTGKRARNTRGRGVEEMRKGTVRRYENVYRGSTAASYDLGERRLDGRIHHSRPMGVRPRRNRPRTVLATDEHPALGSRNGPGGREPGLAEQGARGVEQGLAGAEGG